jgi:hypothetical protein
LAFGNRLARISNSRQGADYTPPYRSSR